MVRTKTDEDDQRKNLLTATAEFVQSTSLRRRFRTPIVQMKSVKGD